MTKVKRCSRSLRRSAASPTAFAGIASNSSVAFEAMSAVLLAAAERFQALDEAAPLSVRLFEQAREDERQEARAVLGRGDVVGESRNRALAFLRLHPSRRNPPHERGDVRLLGPVAGARWVGSAPERRRGELGDETLHAGPVGILPRRRGAERRRCRGDERGENARNQQAQHARTVSCHGRTTTPHGRCPTPTDFVTRSASTSITDMSLLTPLVV